MAQNTRFFEEFKPHTKTKLAILRTYLAAWAMKLLKWGGAGRTVYFVDAFAGAGADREGTQGSPVIATRIALQTQAQLRAGGLTEATMRVIGIEKNRGRFAALQEHMIPFNETEPGVFQGLEGELSDHIDRILSLTRGAPTLYFLDPYGLTGLDASTYPKALQGKHNELFVLFADIGAARLHGVVTAGESNLDAQIARLRVQETFLPEIEHERAEAEDRLRMKDAMRNKALDVTRPASAACIARALGGIECVERLARVHPSKRADAFLEAFLRLLLDADAGHLLSVLMRNAEGRRVYSLVHASKSVKGLVAMKQAVHTGLNAEELPAEVCERMRDDLRVSVSLTVQVLEMNFPKREVRWAPERGKGSIQDFVLENTPMFPFQFPELKLALVEAGYIELGRTGKPKTPILVRFPPSEPRTLQHSG